MYTIQAIDDHIFIIFTAYLNNILCIFQFGAEVTDAGVLFVLWDGSEALQAESSGTSIVPLLQHLLQSHISHLLITLITSLLYSSVLQITYEM